MKAAKVTLSGLTGTSLMTLFSYLVSQSKDRNFKEPERLAELMERLSPSIDKGTAVPAGWAAHYGMGMAWAFVHAFLFQKGVKTNLKNTFILGALSGAAGVLIWRLTFKLHPNPPQIHFNRYAGHLILAHIIYTIGTASIDRKVKV